MPGILKISCLSVKPLNPKKNNFFYSHNCFDCHSSTQTNKYDFTVTSVTDMLLRKLIAYIHAWFNFSLGPWRRREKKFRGTGRILRTMIGVRLIWNFFTGVMLKVAQNSFQHFPRRRFWWVITTTLYQLMLQLWYQKTAQLLVNTLVLFSSHNRLP